MSNELPESNLDDLLSEILTSTPLLFIKEFLRDRKQHSKQVRIGVTRNEVRSNLRDAILARKIGLTDLQTWLNAVEGWGKQHLYLSSVGKRSINHAHLLNTNALTRFLKKSGYWKEPTSDEPESAHILDRIDVDDEVARISWRSNSILYERHEELDEERELDDGEYEFRAYRRSPRRDVSRIIIRKTDGIVLVLIDLPLGDDHNTVKLQMEEVARSVLAPVRTYPIALEAIIRSLDQDAVALFGPKAHRDLALGIAPTQAKFRTDGARVEFRSTRESTGYTESDPVRHVRKALQIGKFVGEAGKFRLTFEGARRKAHDMVVSFHAEESRIFLFSRMDEVEVFRLVDQLVPFGRTN